MPVGLLDFEGPLVTMRVAVVTVLVVIMVVVMVASHVSLPFFICHAP